MIADDQKQIAQDQAIETQYNAQAANDSAAAAAARKNGAIATSVSPTLAKEQTTAQTELQNTYAAQKAAYNANLQNAQSDLAAANKKIAADRAQLAVMTPGSPQYNDVANLLQDQKNAADKANKDINTWNGMIRNVGAPPAQSGGFNPLQIAETVVLGPAAPLILAGAGPVLNGAGNLAGAAANTKLASQVDSVAYPAASQAQSFLGQAGSWIAGAAGSLFNGAKNAVGSAGQFIAYEASPVSPSGATVAPGTPSGVSQGPVGGISKCSAGNGLYCGANLNPAGDKGSLYQCSDGRVTLVKSCAHGCAIMPSGVNDRCAN